MFDAGGYRIDVLKLDSPTANLYKAQRETLVHGTSWGTENHAEGRVAQPYGAYLLPGSTLDDLHLVVSQWNTTTNWPYQAIQFHANVASATTPQARVWRV